MGALTVLGPSARRTRVSTTALGVMLLLTAEVPATLNRGDSLLQVPEPGQVTAASEPAISAGVGKIALGFAGVAVLGLGVGLVVEGLTADPFYTLNCFGPGECSDSPTFLRFGYAQEPVQDVFTVKPNGNGLMIAPLGYSLMLTGAIWLTGAIFGDPGDVPFWLSIPAGVAAFALSYGITAALEPPPWSALAR